MFFVMSRGMPFLLELGLLLYCLIDVVQTPPKQCRNLGKVWWIALIVVLPLAGGIAWLVAGRPRRFEVSVEGRRPVVAPDDDPDFLAELRRRQANPKDGRDGGDDGPWVER